VIPSGLRRLVISYHTVGNCHIAFYTSVKTIAFSFVRVIGPTAVTLGVCTADNAVVVNDCRRGGVESSPYRHSASCPSAGRLALRYTAPVPAFFADLDVVLVHRPLQFFKIIFIYTRPISPVH
jgi:hypothetical protein